MGPLVSSGNFPHFFCPRAWAASNLTSAVRGYKMYLIVERHASLDEQRRQAAHGPAVLQNAWDAAQAWEKEAAATQQSSLAPEQQREVGRQLVGSLGDASSAERCTPPFFI